MNDLLTREELLRLPVESLVEKVLGLRQDLADDAEELAALRTQLRAAPGEPMRSRCDACGHEAQVWTVGCGVDTARCRGCHEAETPG